MEFEFARASVVSGNRNEKSPSRAKSNKPEMKGASLLSIYLKNLLGDLP